MTPRTKQLRVSRELALPLDVAGEAMAILATRGAGKSYTSAVVVEELYGADVQLAVIDPTGVYWGLRASGDGDGAGLPITVLGGAHGDVPLEPTSGALIADVLVDTGQSLVLDLSDFPTKNAQTQFMIALGERLYARKARARTTLHLVMDEANEFCPQRPMRDEARMLGAWERIVGKGRSRGLGITLVSQRSAALNKNVLDLVDSLVVMRTTGPRDRKAIAGWLTHKALEDEVGFIDSLPGLPTGTAWVWSPVRDILKRVAVRRIATFDSYRTPKPGEKPAEPRQMAPIDLDKLGQQIRATAERAKADDPKELRRRISELERQLRATGDSQPKIIERTVEVEVPVPMISEDDSLVLKNLRTSLVDLEAAMGGFVGRIDRLLEYAGEKRDIRRDKKAPEIAKPQVAKQEPRTVSRTQVEARSTKDSVRAFPDLSRHLSKPQQAILDALAWFESVGTSAPRRPPLAAVAGASSKSSGFDKNISTLRTAGFIDFPSAGHVCLTDAGRARAESPPIPSTTEALHEAIFAMVSKPQATLLKVLIESYPDALSREELAERAGVSSESSGFDKNISTLKSFELVTYPQRGYVAALPTLFVG